MIYICNTPGRLQFQLALQLYTAKELQGILENKGFVTIARYGLDGSDFIHDGKTLNILTVARRV